MSDSDGERKEKGRDELPNPGSEERIDQSVTIKSPALEFARFAIPRFLFYAIIVPALILTLAAILSRGTGLLLSLIPPKTRAEVVPAMVVIAVVVGLYTAETKILTDDPTSWGNLLAARGTIQFFSIMGFYNLLWCGILGMISATPGTAALQTLSGIFGTIVGFCSTLVAYGSFRNRRQNLD